MKDLAVFRKKNCSFLEIGSVNHFLKTFTSNIKSNDVSSFLTFSLSVQ